MCRGDGERRLCAGHALPVALADHATDAGDLVLHALAKLAGHAAKLAHLVHEATEL